MKKFTLIMGMLLSFTMLANAQTEEKKEADPLLTKNGYKFLPVKGDYAIGISANPFLKYVGNAFNGNSDNNAPEFHGVNGNLFDNGYVVYGKYFLEDNRAIRAKLGVNIGSEKYKQSIGKDGSTTGEMVEDALKQSSTSIELSLGYEFRRGHGRLQGFYGGEASLAFASAKNSYDYGNSFSTTNTNPSSYNFYNQTISSRSSRTTSEKSGAQFGFEARGFVGVEYFIAPQIALGGEFSLGLGFLTKGKSKTETETWNFTDNKVETDKYEGFTGQDVSSDFGFKTRTQGNIFVMFYF